MKPELDLVEESSLWEALSNAGELALRAIDACLAASGARIRDGAEVSLVLCDDAHIAGLNKQWRGIDQATNVLSFPAFAADKIATAPMLGDIVMAFETLQREALAEDKSLSDHFSHLVAHGFLHLLGYDHQNADEADRMENIERAALARLGIADPYASSVLVGDARA